MKDSDRRWPWYQQISDAAVTALGIGVGVTMTYRNSFPILGIVLFAACVGKISASQLLRVLMGRWEDKP